MATKNAWLAVFFLIVSLLAPAIKSEVLELDDSNFSETIGKHDFVVVEFFAPWCGHCKQLAPEYEAAAAELKGHDPEIILATVNADEEKNKKLAADYEVRGFPTLKIIRNKGAVVEEYKGPRQTEGIVSYLKKQAGPATFEIKSAEEATDFVSQNKIAIIGVFKSYDSDEFKTYNKLAEALRADYDFRHTLDSSLLPLKDEPLAAPAVRLFKAFDERFNDFTDFEFESLKTSVEEKSMPTVLELVQDPEMQGIFTKFFNAVNTKAFFFLNLNEANAEDLRAAYKEAAILGKAKNLAFMIIDAAENPQALQHFGLDESKIPSIIIQEMDGKKFISEGIESSKLSTFVSDYMDGKVEQWIKSEPIPEKNDEPVKVVVRNSLSELVLDSGKDVLLEFYAPWCGHCKKLVPTLEKVALHYKDNPSVVIGKFDATANDVPQELFEVKGFPTLYLYTAQKSVVPYEGDRTEADLISFIQEHKTSKDAAVTQDTKEPVEEIKTEDTKESAEEIKDEL